MAVMRAVGISVRFVCFSSLAFLGLFALGCGDSKTDTKTLTPTPVLDASVNNQMEFMKKQQEQSGQQQPPQ